MRLFAVVDHEAIAQDLLDVINSTCDILCYASTIEKTNMPTILDAPDWYNAYSTNQWPSVKAHAMTWIKTLAPKMRSTIDSTIYANQLVAADMMRALRDITRLQSDPNNEAAKKDLTDALEDIVDNELKSVPGRLSDFATMLATFQVEIVNDQTVMLTAATSALQSANTDHDKIKVLEDHIRSLKDNIESYKHQITMMDLPRFGGILIAVVGVGFSLVSGPAGAVVIGAGITMIGGSVLGEFMLNKAIAQAMTDIANDQLQISALDAQIVVLLNLKKDLDNLAALNAKAQSAAAKVQAFWTEFTNDVLQFIATIRSAEDEPDYGKAQEDILAAQAQWSQLQALLAPVTDLRINIQPEPVILNKAA